MALNRPFIPLCASVLALLALAAPGSSGAAAPSRPAKASPPPAAPAAPAGDDDATFFETVEVNVINVDVYVTDKSGRTVKGLTQDDFTVLEDGKPVEISNFYAAEGGTIEGEAAVLAPGEPGAPGKPAAEPAPVPEDQRLHLAIFVDNQNLTPAARNRALNSLRGFVSNRVSAADRVVLATYDGPGTLKIRQEATSDPQALVKAVEEVASGAAGGFGRRMDREMLVRDIETAVDPNSDDPMTAQTGLEQARQSFAGIEQYAQQQLQQARTTVNMLGRFIDSLSGLKGRKILLYVSGGIPLLPAQALTDAWTNRYGNLDSQLQIGSARLEGMSTDATNLFDRLAARANASRVTLYSLGAMDDMSGGNAETAGTAYWGRLQGTLESSNQAAPLVMLAAATGGMAAVENMSPESLLNLMSNDLSSYYSLGYTPSHRKTGKDHKVKVTLKDRSLNLRYRESYRDRTAQELLSDQTMSALLIGQQDNPLGIEVDLEQESPAPKAKDQVQLTILVRFPMGNLVLLPQDSYHEGRVTMFLGSKDNNGQVSELTQIAVPIRVKNDQVLTAMSQTVAYRTKLQLRSKPHTIAVGVRDEIGNVGSTTTAAYTPGQVGQAAAAAAATEPGR